MSSQDNSRYTTAIETNRWESFTRLTFAYFADQGYEVEQSFDAESGSYELIFTDDERDERAIFIYKGSSPDMAQESLQQMQKLFEGSDDFTKMWTDMF